jgi:hypothetical protein
MPTESGFATCPLISLRICNARFPIVVEKRITRSIVSAEVFAPPTTSTRGTRCGGLKGCPGYATPRVLTLRLDTAHRDTGGAGDQYGRRGKDRIHFCE